MNVVSVIFKDENFWTYDCFLDDEKSEAEFERRTQQKRGESAKSYKEDAFVGAVDGTPQGWIFFINSMNARIALLNRGHTPRLG